jgi:hypothetical protein
MKVLQIILVLPLVSAFSTTLQKTRGHTFSSSLSQQLYAVQNHEEAATSSSHHSRRTFLSTAAILSTIMTFDPLPSVADDVDDLAMPSEEEQKAREVSGSCIQPMYYQDSFRQVMTTSYLCRRKY